MKIFKTLMLGAISISVLFTSCKKDQVETEIPIVVEALKTDEGSRVTVTSTSGKETITGTFVTLGNGQLLNSSFYRQFNISTDKGSLNFRFSFPSSMIGKVDANMYKKHALYEFPLSLQESGSLSSVIAEGYFSSSSVFNTNNIKGNVTLKQNHLYGTITYSLFAEFEATVIGKDNKTYSLSGVFWKK